ncbi:MAG: DUF3836 domain-containing protein [Prevotella sp.]|jgi:hypothetical protein|nr:DUF3836 domain-containing protein [Prevotella sp.]
MNSRKLFSLFAILFLSLSIYANDPETVMFSNVETTETGCVKEFLFCDKDTNAPLTKTIYRYNAAGHMQEKATYEWKGDKGWTGIQKYEYTYNSDNQPATPIIYKWNNKTNDWSEK